MSKYRDSLDDQGRADLDKLTALRKSGYTGPVGPDNEPATKDNTPPEHLRLLAALHALPSWDSYRQS